LGNRLRARSTDRIWDFHFQDRGPTPRRGISYLLLSKHSPLHCSPSSLSSTKPPKSRLPSPIAQRPTANYLTPHQTPQGVGKTNRSLIIIDRCSAPIYFMILRHEHSRQLSHSCYCAMFHSGKTYICEYYLNDLYTSQSQAFLWTRRSFTFIYVKEAIL
jgi:hypothetical protein